MDAEDKIDRGRRSFIRSAAAISVTAAVASTAAATTAACSPREPRSAHDADIIVVGSGAAALASAIAARKAGQSVIIVEAAPSMGGTTIKSDGGFWIPNNRLMRGKGLIDRREDAIAFMLQHAYPAAFNRQKPQMGVTQVAYDLIAAFYDHAAPIIEDLEKSGVLSYTGFELIDYLDGAENMAPRGRTLLPKQADGTIGGGRELIRQLKAPLTAQQVPVLLRHRVTGLVRNGQDEIVGVDAETAEGTVRLRARKAVIFGTGGYSQNQNLVTRFQPGPIYGGCAVPTNQGDFITIGGRAGAMLGNMTSAWRAQVVLEEVLKSPSIARNIFHIPGDSMLLVNKLGRRVLNEKRNYNDRTKVHYDWNSDAAEQSNRLLFMIYDQRTRDVFAGNPPIPDAGASASASHEIRADSIAGLAGAIQQRLDSLAEALGPYPLDEGFARNLAEQIARFNRIAASGVDPEFHRGQSRYDKEWNTGYAEKDSREGAWPKNDGPNPTVHPFTGSGPYFAAILAPGALDTNGGPQIDARGRVLDAGDVPIPGLYGAGNCISSPAGSAYWGAGSTLGLALTFGTLAGQSAASEPEKDAD